MEKNIYTFGAIYLAVVLVVSIIVIVYEAYINHNWYILSFIPIIVILWFLNVEFLAIDKKYNYHDY